MPEMPENGGLNFARALLGIHTPEVVNPGPSASLGRYCRSSDQNQSISSTILANSVVSGGAAAAVPIEGIDRHRVCSLHGEREAQNSEFMAIMARYVRGEEMHKPVERAPSGNHSLVLGVLGNELNLSVNNLENPPHRDRWPADVPGCVAYEVRFGHDVVPENDPTRVLFTVVGN